MKIELDNKFSELNRRVKLTSKARYNASRRLSLKNKLSQWTLALLSVALIFISLISASGIEIEFHKQYVDIMQIIFAVLILAYSLLLSMGDYSARAVKIHRCGMELGRLARKIKPYENSDNNDEKYEQFYTEYYNCLEKYENHENVDFLIADCSSKDWYNSKELKGAEGANYFRLLLIEFFNKTKMYLQIQIGTIIPVLHYFIIIGGVYFWLYLMVAGNA